MKRRTAGFLAMVMAAVLVFGGASAGYAAEAETSAAAEEIAAPDVDLTILSSTMMIAEATNLIQNPEAYLGKVIRTAGVLQAFEYNGRYILSTYLGDATGCCGTTIEFNRTGDYKFPEDYPAVGSVVFVQGVFEQYEEDGVTYCWLNDAVMQTQKFQS